MCIEFEIQVLKQKNAHVSFPVGMVFLLFGWILRTQHHREKDNCKELLQQSYFQEGPPKKQTGTDGTDFYRSRKQKRNRRNRFSGTEAGTGTMPSDQTEKPFLFRGTVGTENRNRSACSTHEPQLNQTEPWPLWIFQTFDILRKSHVSVAIDKEVCLSAWLCLLW